MSASTTDPAHRALPDFDPTAPVFEVWINGRRFACTQVPAKAFRMIRAMHAGRPNLAAPELRIVNDRRKNPR